MIQEQPKQAYCKWFKFTVTDQNESEPKRTKNELA